MSGNTASVLYGVPVYDATSVQTGTNVAVRSFAVPGKIRIIPTSASSSNTWAAPGGDVGGPGVGTPRLGMVPGRTYTALARCTLLSAQTGGNRRIGAHRDGWGVINQSPSAPNAPGTYPLRVTFTVPLDAVSVGIRLYNGASLGNGDVYWDDFALIEGVYTGPYLDGDMPGCVWRGTPHASQTVGYPALTAA